MAPLPKLYPLTLTFVFEIKYLSVAHFMYKNAQIQRMFPVDLIRLALSPYFGLSHFGEKQNDDRCVSALDLNGKIVNYLNIYCCTQVTQILTRIFK